MRQVIFFLIKYLGYQVEKLTCVSILSYEYTVWVDFKHGQIGVIAHGDSHWLENIKHLVVVYEIHWSDRIIRAFKHIWTWLFSLQNRRIQNSRYYFTDYSVVFSYSELNSRFFINKMILMQIIHNFLCESSAENS